MAHLIRSPKSGSDWTTNDLLAYNIRVSSQSPHNFYGIPLPPVASLNDLDPDLVSGTLSTQGLKDETRGLLRSRYAIPLLISGDPNRSAQTGVTLIHGSSTILLVVQEDKTIVSARDPEAQVIAEAIATFQYNNRTRARLAVAIAEYPTNPKVVKECVVASNSRRLSEGMESVDFRQVALQHYTAFRTLAESQWSAFIFPKEMEV
ncbi:hypothetical protein BJV74DRAFT_877853 [Russula compacta]|nr:hypothetical protein BJV74DRAFT_877853 [Russula compacta]